MFACNPRWGSLKRSITRQHDTHEQIFFHRHFFVGCDCTRLGGCRLHGLQPAGLGGHGGHCPCLHFWRMGVAPVSPCHLEPVRGAGRDPRAPAEPGCLDRWRASFLATCGARAHRRRAHRLARTCSHALFGGLAGDAGHAGHIFGHGRHPQWRCVCVGGNHRPAGHAIGFLGPHQRLGAGVWHVRGRSSLVRDAGPDVGDQPA